MAYLEANGNGKCKYGGGFDASAVEAVEHYRFKPAMRAGEPVAVALNVEVNFKKF